MWGTRQLALTGTIPITRMLAHLTGTTVRAGSRAEYLSARAPGITAAGDVLVGDTLVGDGPMPADLRDLAASPVVVSKDAALKLATASQDTG
jgi:hypothetical protein